MKVLSHSKKLFEKAPFTATIIWTGGNLTGHQIGPLKKALDQLGLKDVPLSSDLAEKLMENVVMDEKDKWANDFLKKMLTANLIQQQLDQEIEFAINVKRVEQLLQSLGAKPIVYRPANKHLLNPFNKEIGKSWIEVEEISKVPFRDNLDKKSMLVTMGHGSRHGRTSTGNNGELSQEEIAKLLSIPEKIGSSLFYVPLQCYPSQAVELAKKMGWISASVPSDESIISSDILEWLDEQFIDHVMQWLKK